MGAAELWGHGPWLLFSHTLDRGAFAVQHDERSTAGAPPAKLPPNESNTLTLNPLPVDRAPALRGAGLFAVAFGAWGLGAVTPGPWSVDRWPRSGIS